jgi:hypothetical protein
VGEVRTIRIETVQKPSGLLIATSPDLPGLNVAEHSVKELAVELPKVVTALYEAMGVQATVTAPAQAGRIDALKVVVNG